MAVSKDKRAPDGDLHGKVALVTGAARRIGREIALTLASRGADVAITYLTSSREAQDTFAEIQHLGVRSLALCCDVTDPKDVQATIKQVVKEFGGLDILVNNAAIYETVNFEDITPQQWDAVFATNVRGPFLVSQAALPALRKRKGRIINLGSLGGIRPWATHAHYCSSKAALTMLTQVMAKALAPDIAVNCVAPGMIDMHEPKSAAFFRKTAAHTPMKRNGTAAEVAAAVAFFATAPQFITGQLLVVDGGLSLD
ncbi:MAG TPA: SDR family oxidoreductase [Terriglobales bacterium]|nr:SDR family oxidoreductase [Terriglobales bacterium]